MKPTQLIFLQFIDMRFITALCALLISGTGTAQSLSGPLKERMAKRPASEYHSVRVEFIDNVDCFALNAQFKSNNTPVNERPPIVINRLMQQSEASQSQLLLDLESRKDVRDIQSFWIANVLFLKAKRTAIEYMLSYPGVSLLDLEENKIVLADYFKIGPAALPKAVGAPEPGLIAINAPALWAMGYTGKGKVTFDFDTGVWPDHPSFKDRFIGRRFPIEQAWDGFYSPTPTGNYSSHGTHTLGTMAGLDTLTQDTTGVAFGAYWIANDHIRGTVAELPSIPDMMASFQWALNPDGDISTTHDIPHVINNSWRWYDEPDTLYCSGTVVNLMNAIEAAGIANVFSGGNFGPSNTTISSPQRINTSDVNTFSVGSVNANLSFPYPISSFSSIGPKQCPGSGSLAIHPEVVAPGQNVRSAYGPTGYNSISGTSMAAPHVSGAVLLLKEAFPNASGEDILRALYTTATDMGAAGEDNTFGMGLINCLAAFNELALTFTPVDPSTKKWDLALQQITSPFDGSSTCQTSFDPTIVVENLGDSTITEIDFEYYFLGQTALNYQWTGTLSGHSSATITLPNISPSALGQNELIVIASYPEEANDYDIYDNRIHSKFYIIPEYTVPYIENFENGFDSNWQVTNEDGGITWEIDSTGGLPWSNQSASMPHFFYSPIAGQIDELTGPIVSTNLGQGLTLKFDRAKEDINSTSKVDTLSIYVSTDCGVTWPDLIYKKYGSDLYTIDTTNVLFVPSRSNHWSSDSVDISTFAGQDIQLKFVSSNRKGQNIYIDNVRIYENNDPAVELSEIELELEIYPNPTTEILNIPAEFQNKNYLIFSEMGKLVQKGISSSYIDIKSLAQGTYTLSIGANSTNIVIIK